MLTNKKIAFLGGGAMGEALIKGILQAKLVHPGQISVSDVSMARLAYLADTYQVSTDTDNAKLAAAADIVFFTVKPQVIDALLQQVANAIRPVTTVISIVAGITIATLQQSLPNVPIIRVMPNTPVAVGEGMSVLARGPYADEAAAEMAIALFSAVGQAVVMDESQLDAVTGLSGSGPGYGFVIIDALADAGVRAGLSRANAIVLAAQTMLGAAKMVLATGEHPGKLRDMVTSPGGTTIAGIHVMEQQGVRAALSDAVMAATNRSREMGKR